MTLEQFQHANSADNIDTRSGLLNEYSSMSPSDLSKLQHNPSNSVTDAINNTFGTLQITSLGAILNQLPQRTDGSNSPESSPSLPTPKNDNSLGSLRTPHPLVERSELNAVKADEPKVFTVEVPVIDYNKADVTPETIKEAKEKFEKEMKKDAPPKGSEEMVKAIADGILSGDPAVIQKMLKDVKTPEDLEKLQKAAEYVGKKLGIYASAGKTFDGKPYLQMRAYFQHQNLAGAWENDVHMSIYPDEVSTRMKSTLPVAGEDRPRLKKVEPEFLAKYLQKGLVNKDK